VSSEPQINWNLKFT